MKTLSLLQPWASLWAAGIKRYETRSWDTAYRGPLAIHASARKDLTGRELYDSLWSPKWYKSDTVSLMKKAGLPARFDDLPFGAVLATTTLDWTERTDGIIFIPYSLQPFLGDYSPGRFAWRSGPSTMLSCPIPAKGRLGLWECPLI